MSIPTRTIIISLILKAVVVIAAAIGVFISAYASKDTFMGGSRVFMFFTIQSNIAIAIVALIGAVLLIRKRLIRDIWFVIKFVGTVSITLTGAVFTFVLAPTLGEYAWNLQNILTHVVVPLAAIADFFVTGAYGDIKKSSVFFVVLPPAAYVVYAAIAYVAGWEFMEGINYPYFFLNWGGPAGAFGFMKTFPFMGTAWWIVALLGLLLIVGYISPDSRRHQKKKCRVTSVTLRPPLKRSLPGFLFVRRTCYRLHRILAVLILWRIVAASRPVSSLHSLMESECSWPSFAQRAVNTSDIISSFLQAFFLDPLAYRTHYGGNVGPICLTDKKK